MVAGLAQGTFEEILVIPYEAKDEVHFPTLRKSMGVAYSDMLFFDDEGGNIRSVRGLAAMLCFLPVDQAGVVELDVCAGVAAGSDVHTGVNK